MAEKIVRGGPGGPGPGGPGAPGAPGSMVPGGKSKNLKKAYTDFMHYLGRYKWSILVAVAFSVVGSILNLVGPDKISDMTDLISEGLTGTIDIPAVVEIGVLLAVLYGLGFVLNYVQGFLMATVSQRVTQQMRRDISKKINKLPLKYFDSTTTGDVLSRVTNDVDTVGSTMNMSVSTLVSSLALLFGSVLLMFLTNWILAATGVAASLIGFWAIMMLIAKSQRYFVQQQLELGGINGQVEETYSGLNVVKAYNGEKAAKEEFHQRSRRLYICAWKSQFMSGLMMPLMTFIGTFAYVVVCIVGAVLAVQGSITFGTIVAFMLYIRLFTQPLQNISQALASVQSMAAACERVFEFLDEQEMEDEGHKTRVLAQVEGDVEFDHVRFGYDPGKTIIHDFSSRVKAGQKIAIVGPTGAGKTTLVNLLMRFYELDGGSITIDGVPTRDLTRESIHSLFGMVLQDTWMFEGTLRENLVYNQAGVTDETLDEVCAATGLTGLVRRLPQGYDTVLGDNASLSAGQKQLITIARAMVEDAPLLILDEATSSVDTRTEMKVQRAMDNLTRGRTSFVIAHRLSTIRNADCILVVRDGDIVESGNHEELMAQGGFYAELYNSQFEQVS